MPAAWRLSAAASPPMPPPTTMTIMFRALLSDDLSALNDLGPQGGLWFQARHELLPRLCGHEQAQCGEAFDDVRIAQRRSGGLIEQVDDGLGRSFWNRHPPPIGDRESGQAGLDGGRHIGQCGDPLVRADSKRDEL